MKTGFFRAECAGLPRFKYDLVNIILNVTKAQNNGNSLESVTAMLVTTCHQHISSSASVYDIDVTHGVFIIVTFAKDHVVNDNTASEFSMVSNVWWQWKTFGYE